MTGTLSASSKLQIGYYAQHQTEELNKNLTAFEQMQLTMKGASETQIRSHLGAFGLTQQKADTQIAQLSGGEKARLLFAIMTRHAPNILLLDEPTNHLDIDARDALIEALNTYKGAVILITHDPHLIELTADRLWLVDNGRCSSYDGDLEDYKELLSQKARIQSAGKNDNKNEKQTVSRKDERREAAEKRLICAPLRKALKETEKNLEQLNLQKEKIEEMLEDPTLYMIGLNAAKVKNLKISLSQITQEIEITESRWLELSEQLENLL